MPRTIFLRVGNSDRVSVRQFIDTLRNFLSVLQEFDATVSGDRRGSMVWEVVSLRKDSPPVVGVAPHQKLSLKRRNYPDYSEAIEKNFILGASILSAGGERPAYVSDASLDKIKKLAKRALQLGPMSVYIEDGSNMEPQALITETTLHSVEQLTGVQYSAYSSVVGSLDSISVHRNMEFRIWDETTNKPVLCKFQERDLDRVKSLLQSRVTVTGFASYNNAGNPISVLVEELQPLKKRQLPTIDEMSGLVKDFTDGKPLKQYLEDIGDE